MADLEEAKKEASAHHMKHTLTAEFYSTISPTVSRLYMMKADEISRFSRLTDDERAASDLTTCTFCGTCLTPENVRIRLKPAPKQTTKILRKLQGKESNLQPMGKLQLRLLERAKNSNVIKTVRCLTCNRSSNFPVGRKDRRFISKAVPLPDVSAKKKRKRKKHRKNQDVNAGILQVTKSTDAAGRDSPLHADFTKKTTPLPNKQQPPLNKGQHHTLPVSANVKKPKFKGGDSHNILKKMLHKQEEEKKNQSNALGDFLSSL